MKKLFSCLFVATSIFANNNDACDPCPPSFCPPENCAYNAPKGIDVDCSWDAFVTASFLYWEAKEDNIELGTKQTGELENDSATLERIPFCFSYKPAFKVGVGMDFGCDGWELSGEYTYFRSSVTTSTSLNPVGGTLIRFPSTWFPLIAPFLEPFVEEATSASAKWDADFDLLDILLSRDYYVGRCLTFKTSAGLRAAWIRQDYNLTVLEDLGGTLGVNTLTSNNSIRSWGIGPAVGVDIDWKMWCGFRIFLDTFASILFTDYTTVSSNVDDLFASGNVDTLSYTSGKDPCFIRPHTEMTLGLGWGDHFWCNKWYFDLEVGYSVNVYWDQNMFIQYLPITNQSQSPIPLNNLGGNLYTHGLTLTGRLDF